MTSKRHSLTLRSSGFIPLAGGPAADMTDNDIPLSTVRSNASTGARKPKSAVATSTAYDSSSPSANEKAGGLHLRYAGRRRKLSDGLGRSGTGGSDDVRVNALGRLYAKIVGFSVVTRYMVYVVPVGLLLAAPLVVLAVTDNRTALPLGSRKPETGDEIRGPPLFALFLWIEISWLSLWLAKIAAWFLPKIFIFFCGIVSKGVRKYATVLQNLNITLSLFLSALASWLTFANLFSLANAQEIGWVVTLERVLRALFASSAVLLAEKATVQLIGVSYHQRSFANRIKASKRDVYLLGLLYDASRTLFPMYCPEFAEEDYVINDSIEMMLRGKNGRKTPAGSATPMRFIGDVGRLGGKVTHAVGNIAHEITGKQVLNPNSAHSIVLEALEKRLPSEALGRRIWMSFVLEGKDALYPDDFREVLGSSYAEEAEEAFDAIDSDMNGDISLDEMMRKVVEIGKERKAIGEGMKDIGQALRVFDKVLLFVVLLIVIIIFFFVFDTTTLRVLGSAGTALLSLSFVFATTTQEFLGSCIFLFVKHPYDVGDRVDIGKVQMVVDRISLLYTVFTRIDVMQVVQVPNIQLNNLWIDNISRSKAMKESIELNVSYDTTFEDIELLRLEMEKFVRSPDNSRDFQPDFNISVGGVGDLDKMILFVSIKHKSNWHNDSVRALRRSKFMCALALALKKIPIYGPGGGTEELGGPTNPSYSVAVSDEAAAAAREEAARKKEASRMAPTQPSKTEQELREAEQHAVSELNTRPLAVQTQGLWDYRDHHDDVRSATSHDDSRSRDIDTLRSELIKRASTRGRRRAGEGLHNLMHTDNGGHGDSLTRAPSSRLKPFDEEAQTGISSPYRDLERSAALPGQLATTEEERKQEGLHPSFSQRSQRARLHRGPSLAYRPST